MKAQLKVITAQKPQVYGVIYFSIIPLYALLYAIIPQDSLQFVGVEPNCISYLYFSVVTITTLGYGDITPSRDIAQLLTASESIIGIILIGLFLNALSHQHSLIVKEEEARKQKDEKLKQAISRLKAFDNIVNFYIKKYLVYTIPITSPHESRNFVEVNREFSFSDMRDMFGDTDNLETGHFSPAINHFFAHKKIMNENIQLLIREEVLRLWPDLENLCLDYLSENIKTDLSSNILGSINIKHGGEKSRVVIAKAIKEYEGEVKFIEGHMLSAYFLLYFQIKNSFEFIDSYSNRVEEIIGS